MKAILLFTAHYISFSMSQFPLNLTGWETLSPAGNTNCETIGGYKDNSNKINIYGGRDASNAKYIYDPEQREYTSTVTISYNISFINQAAERDRSLFYIDTNNVIGYDMTTDSPFTYAALDGDTVQEYPALCFDDLNATLLYVVGDGEIETCVIPNTETSSSCTKQDHVSLEDIFEPSCEVYKGVIYVFGGISRGDNLPVDSIWQCDPTTPDSCTEITPVLSVARGGIRTVRLNCFDNNYVVLIGGRIALDDASFSVDIFDLKEETIGSDGDWNMSTARKHFVAVYDPVDDQVFVFGGNTGPDISICTDSVEVTKTGLGGLCNPTKEPTSDPTVDPTVDPTIEPTVDPTVDPTVAPTTMNPTTSDPTQSPVEETTVAAASPTPKPTRKPYSPDTNDYQTGPIVYGFIIVILVIICCIVIVCAVWVSKQEERNDGSEVEAAVIVTYCENCGKALPCGCDTCNKCGKASCGGDCGEACPRCGSTVCDGNACRQSN